MGASQGKDKSVIIVGGGYAGTTVAKGLDAYCKVTLIEKSDSMTHKYAMPRACVVPGWEEATRVPLDKILKNGTILRADVTKVEGNTVTFTDGNTLTGDFIVLAHGGGLVTFPSGPIAETPDGSSLKKKLKEKQELIKEKDKILIVGGGPVGVELAGFTQF
jgi:NADH dehydrogenase FAD-containing subunit